MIPPPVNGLAIVPDFVNIVEETELLAHVGAVPGAFGRRYKRFGVTVYETARRERNEDPPAWLRELGERLPMNPPDEYTLNDWQPGSGLGHHTDKGGPVICVLSLAGAGTLQFAATNRPHVTVICPRRALLVMTGPARYTYTHAVIPSENHRISIVFRTAY